LGFALSVNNDSIKGVNLDAISSFQEALPYLLLKMPEPNPDINMQLWIRWFDQLSEYIAILKTN
jgi:hypothetical protein